MIVAVSMRIKPGLHQRAVEVALKMVAETKKEVGCIAYDFFSDLADANHIHVYEEWETAAHLDAHMKTPHMAEFAAAIADVLDGPMTGKRYEVPSAA